MKMEIRKEFKFELAHIVRNAWSRRCSMNVHGHSYRAELLLEGLGLDNGQMLLDFGLVKKWVNDFMDSFDHSCMLWNREEDKEVSKFFIQNFERVILTPFSSSAEQQAKFITHIAGRLVSEYLSLGENNGSEGVYVSGCRLHETTTGYAEYRPNDSTHSLKMLSEIRIFKKEDWEEVLNNPQYIWISEQIFNEYKEPNWISIYNTSLSN